MTIGLRDTRVPEPLELNKLDIDDSMFFNQRGIPIGTVYDSPSHDCRMYVSFRKKEKHFMRKYNSYAIDSYVVEKLDDEWNDVEMVAVFVIDEGEIFLFDLDTYLDADEDNEGFGDQRFPHVNTAEVVYEGAYGSTEMYPEEIIIE